MSVLAIDAGTTGVTALIVTEQGTIAGRGYQEFRQYFPQPGWVEHLPEGIWQATLAACSQALAAAGKKHEALDLLHQLLAAKDPFAERAQAQDLLRQIGG